jgi:hypothetical protein
MIFQIKTLGNVIDEPRHSGTFRTIVHIFFGSVESMEVRNTRVTVVFAYWLDMRISGGAKI